MVSELFTIQLVHTQSTISTDWTNVLLSHYPPTETKKYRAHP